jgi:hypothetical protein
MFLSQKDRKLTGLSSAYVKMVDEVGLVEYNRMRLKNGIIFGGSIKEFRT